MFKPATDPKLNKLFTELDDVVNNVFKSTRLKYIIPQPHTDFAVETGVVILHKNLWENLNDVMFHYLLRRLHFKKNFNIFLVKSMEKI